MLLLRWLLRPSVWLVVSGLLVLWAVFVVLWPEDTASPQRKPLAAGDAEIAFIMPATNTNPWDRFVAAVGRATDDLRDTYPDIKVRESPRTSSDSTSTAEIVLEGIGSGRRLVFRWYKLTSDWTPDAWMKELLRRKPYPLAIIGGNNTHWAGALANSLTKHTRYLHLAERPLLLLTTATADRIAAPEPGAGTHPDDSVELTTIYPGRTYRFSYTNRQMASAVTRFIWSQPDLIPQADPVYLVEWTDDSYSKDLLARYLEVLPRRVSEDVLCRWMFTAGIVTSGLPPAALGGWMGAGTRHVPEACEVFPFSILTSVGSFASPNPYEAETSAHLLNRLKLQGGAESRRRLLVVTGQDGPSRRFLRDVARTWPDAARRLVVASGDAISFNTVYRDRLITWPIQDLPFTLVFFCHRNPISPGAGFRPIGTERPFGSGPGRISSHSGTEDLLLYTEIVEAIALAHGNQVATPNTFAQGLDQLHVLDNHKLTMQETGRPLFRRRGEENAILRNPGTGEHVVCLRPIFEGERVMAEATLSVYARAGGHWQLVGEKVDGKVTPLRVSYVEQRASGGRTP